MWGIIIIIIIIIIKNTCKTIGLLLEALINPTKTIGLRRRLEALNIAVGDSDAGLRDSRTSA